MRPQPVFVDLQQMRELLEVGQFADEGNDGGKVAWFGGADDKVRLVHARFQAWGLLRRGHPGVVARSCRILGSSQRRDEK